MRSHPFQRKMTIIDLSWEWMLGYQSIVDGHDHEPLLCQPFCMHCIVCLITSEPCSAMYHNDPWGLPRFVAGLKSVDICPMHRLVRISVNYIPDDLDFGVRGWRFVPVPACKGLGKQQGQKAQGVDAIHWEIREYGWFRLSPFAPQKCVYEPHFPGAKGDNNKITTRRAVPQWSTKTQIGQ